jgi:hypothetical protein
MPAILRIIDRPPPRRKDPRSGPQTDATREAEARAEEMHELYRGGMGLKDVGRRFGVSDSWVMHLFESRGWKRRPRPTAPAVIVYKGVRYSPDKDGYLRRCSNPDGTHRHIVLHRVLWEEHNGPIPKGKILIFKDGNRANVAMWNLELTTYAESKRRLAKTNYPRKHCKHCREEFFPHPRARQGKPEQFSMFCKRNFCGKACAYAYRKGRPKFGRLAKLDWRQFDKPKPAMKSRDMVIASIKAQKKRRAS